MLRNSENSWGSVSKTLHWLTVALIVLEVPAGFLMSRTYGLSFRDKEGLALHNFFSQIHHTNGFLILTLVCVRVLWRVSNRATRISAVFRYQNWIAGLTHFGLYALLILLPLSGWAALSVFGEAPIWFFDRAGLIPAILPKLPVKDAHGYGFFASMHVWFFYAGAAVLAVHAAAALWHHFVIRDRVFARMWPLGGPGTAVAPRRDTRLITRESPAPAAIRAPPG